VDGVAVNAEQTLPTVGQRVRYLGFTIGKMDPRTEEVLATLSKGVEGTVVEQRPDSPYPCPEVRHDHADCYCDGNGTIPADPVCVVDWECPEGTMYRRLIRPSDRDDSWEFAR
jgi:hypothetical protein